MSVPRKFTKYYKKSSYDVFLQDDIATVSELEALEHYVETILSLNGLNYLGLAVVKPKYFDVFVKFNCGTALIAINSLNEKSLYIIDEFDNVKELTIEYLENLK